MNGLALKVKEKLPDTEVVNARSIKPLDVKTLERLKGRDIITLEENVLFGGFGEQVKSYFAETGDIVKIKSLGIADKFVCHGSIDFQLAENGLTVDNIIGEIEKLRK